MSSYTEKSKIKTFTEYIPKKLNSLGKFFKDWQDWPDWRRYPAWFFVDLVKNVKNLFVDIYDDLALMIKEWFYYVPQSIWRFFGRLTSNVKFIWRHENWDSDYALGLFLCELETLSKNIRKYSDYEKADKDADQIDEFVSLIRKHDGDKPHRIAMKQIEAKYGKRRTYSTESSVDKNGMRSSRMILRYDKETNNKNADKIFKELMALVDKLQREQKAEWNKAWKSLAKNIETWYH